MLENNHATITIKRNDNEGITITFPANSDIDDMREQVLIPMLRWYGFQEETIKSILPEVR